MPRIGFRSHAEDTDFIAIFLAEQRQRTRRNGIVRRHQPRRHSLIATDFGVHFDFDSCDVVWRKRSPVRKIEPQPVGRNEAALLRDMRAKAIA